MSEADCTTCGHTRKLHCLQTKEGLVALKEKANDGAIKAAVLMMRTQMGSERSYQCGREAAFKDVIRWISEAGTQKQEGS